MPASVFRLVALVLLLGMLTALVLRAPIPSLGLIIDLPTGEVVLVQADSPADQAGAMPGDLVHTIYAYPWSATNYRLFLLPLPWLPGTPTPITVERAGQVVALTLQAGLPTWSEHATTLAHTLLALCCWGTGYFIGTSPRATERPLQWVAWFWVVLGFTLGVFPLLSITSYVLSVALLWVQGTVLAPSAVALHAWYPTRPRPVERKRYVWPWLLATIVLLQLGGLVLLSMTASLTEAYLVLQRLVWLLFLGAFLGSLVLLIHAYQTTLMAHVRRQIRIIGAGCLLALSWGLLLLLLTGILASHGMFVPNGTFTLGTAVIPLAYLLSGVSADLMRPDQVLRRVVTYALAAVSALTLVVLLTMYALIPATPLVVLILAVALFVPCRQIFQHALNSTGDEPNAHHLRQMTAELATILEPNLLVTTLADGLGRALHDPPLAIYVRRDGSDGPLTCLVKRSFVGPEVLDPTSLAPLTRQPQALLPLTEVQRLLPPSDTACPELTELLFHEALVLGGLIQRVDGVLLGLVLLGPRGDRDPYRPHDHQALAQVMAGASLALTNSLNYHEQVHARALIQQLYEHSQQTAEVTTTRIAHAIHTDILGTHLRLNIMDLQRLVDDPVATPVHAQVSTVLEREHHMNQALRRLCEAIDVLSSLEPMGLTLSLRKCTDLVRPSWHGDLTFTSDGEPVPVSERVHRALVHITREALVNAWKHAVEATCIGVSLRFPEPNHPSLMVRIYDNGRHPAVVVARPGHLGIQHMREAARTIDATITWDHPPGGGTVVVVVVPHEALGADYVRLDAAIVSPRQGYLAAAPDDTPEHD
ncbi:hypothetical protein [Candidatus Chloroploca asiatica]|uniref:GAF domain-containing protein n=1 Tax=Candidatus Chloroploca asiatica TaxID=1506545 RepID=A0A2H3KWT1_9CHLR|nr:hypothetical protein [Candidatus Chloroploca asiatica]PDV96821.1 hypothetical protein A9Q02_20295 [Candidatus Chloroploca asiatica]